MQTYTFNSCGEFFPKGQYLVTIVDDNHQELAYRPDPGWVWSPPEYGCKNNDAIWTPIFP